MAHAAQAVINPKLQDWSGVWVVQVYVCSRQWPDSVPRGTQPVMGTANLFAKPAPKAFHSDGSINFEDGSYAEAVDVIVYATGYYYSYPFLDESCGVTVEDNR